MNGTWDNNNRNKTDGFGYTHFETCYKEPLEELMTMINNIGANKCFKVKKITLKKYVICKQFLLIFFLCKLFLQIIEITRIIEIIGLSLSLITLILSLFIFYHYR